MARIAGINIPINKVVHTALTYIHGIGDYNSKLICQKLNIPLNKRVNKLSKKDVDPATFTVNNFEAANLNQSNEEISHIDNMGESQVDQYQFVYSAFK